MVYSATPKSWEKPKCECREETKYWSSSHEPSCPLYKAEPVCECGHRRYLHSSGRNPREMGAPCRVNGCFCREFHDVAEGQRPG